MITFLIVAWCICGYGINLWAVGDSASRLTLLDVVMCGVLSFLWPVVFLIFKGMDFIVWQRKIDD